jgi:hypothetical protein
MNLFFVLSAALAAGLLPAVALAQAPERQGELDLAITDDALQAVYTRNARPVGLPGNDMSIGILFTDDRDIIGTGQVMAPITPMQGMPVSFSVGAKAMAGFLADPSEDVFALAPGAEARFNLAAGRPMAVVGNIFYAPSILTFGDADDVLDFNVRFEVGVADQTTAYAGYRVINFDRDQSSGDDDVINGLQLGVRFAF